MSLSFSQITSLIDLNVGSNSTSFATADKTLYVNQAIDNLLLMLFGQGGGGSWQLDDTNYTDEPILYADLVSGTRSYNFIQDANGNLIIDVYKVFAKQSATGVYKELTPVDRQGTDAPLTMDDGNDTGGIPTMYDKTGGRITLDLVPNYNSTNGLKVLIQRQGTYFISSDTTNKWGFTGIYHEYLVLYPSYQYARAKGLPTREVLKRDLDQLEEKIRIHAGQRQHDVKKQMTPFNEDNR